jgi:phosphoribosylglycinamide formyltransferase-1
MAALITAARDPAYPAVIEMVLSNQPGAGGLTVAHAAGIRTEIIDHRDFRRSREAHEAAIDATLRAAGIEIVCLAGVKLHGCSVHLVTHDMDAGPILAQAAVPVLAGDTDAILADRVLHQEHAIYPAALAAFAARLGV